MSTSAPTIRLPRAPAGGRVTQARVAVSEWTKLRSLRSTLYTLFATVVFTIGIGVIASAVTSSNWSTMSAEAKAGFNPLTTSLAGVNFGVLALGVLGVLLITGDGLKTKLVSESPELPARQSSVDAFVRRSSP